MEEQHEKKLTRKDLFVAIHQILFAQFAAGIAFLGFALAAVEKNAWYLLLVPLGYAVAYLSYVSLWIFNKTKFKHDPIILNKKHEKEYIK